jgi:uncharacterized protein
MTIETFELLVKQFMPLAGPSASFGWQGGEPTLMGLPFFQTALEIQRAYAQPRQHVVNALQTNGTLLNDSWFRFLRKNRILVGLSLDGPRDLHDLYRVTEAGTATWARVLRSSRLLREHRVEFNVLVVLTSAAASRAREIEHFMRKEGLTWTQYIPVIECDSATGLPTDYSITPEDYGVFLCEMFDRWAADWPPRSYIREFDEWLMVHAGYRHPSCIYSRNCGSYVVVEHNGDVFCCDFSVDPHWLLGNIHSITLAEMISSDKFQSFAARHSDLDSECRACPHLALCNGGCPQHRIRISGNHQSPTYHCEGLKKFFVYSNKRFRAMARRRKQEMQLAGHLPED